MSNENQDNPEFQQAKLDAEERHTALVALAGIDDLKRAKKGYAYVQGRLADKAKMFHDKAIDGDTPEEREVNRLVYQIFKNEIIPMVDIDEENHRRTLQGENTP